MDLNLQLGSIRERTCAEGPGERFAIWVQGCSLRCRGCFNPHFWNPRFGMTTSAEQMVRQILDAVERFPDLEGITFLGGEPFEQSAPLAWVARKVKTHGLSVMTFTGYTIEELCDQTHAEFELRKEFLQFTDLLVDGRYEAPNIDSQRPWVGSTNQRFHFLTERYTPEIIFKQTTDRIEITLSPRGTATVNGWATSDAVEKLLENL